MTQADALTQLKTDRNIFLTGAPGSGKSYLVNKYIAWLVDNGIIPAVTASTGIAALQLNGKTLHSWAGIRNDEELDEDDFREIVSNYHNQRRIQATDVLIIDEVSMISPRLLDIVNSIATHVKGNNKPFGGIKVVLVGDFFQLPPVTKGHDVRYAFDAATWNLLNLKTCYLTEQHRTSDQQFIDILTGLRDGSINEEQKQVLREHVREDVSEIKTIRLDTHNAKVDKINDAKLFMHPGAPKTYVMTTTGNEKLVASMKKNCMSPERLILKVGVPVLFTKNDQDLRWVNGTQGVVEKMQDTEILVRTDTGVHTVERTGWEMATGYGKNKVVHASLIQFPLRLAYAITIHKSQGMTLDSAIIDCTNAFACGHGYVGISRVRSLNGLHFQGKLTQGTFKIDERVREFDKKIRA